MKTIKQRDIDEKFLSEAIEAAEKSVCIRRKVGCVAVLKDGKVYYGYNDTPDKTISCKDFYDGINLYIKLNPSTKIEKLPHSDFNRKYEIHAEANIVTLCARNGLSLLDATIYINYQPCWDCSKLLIQSGVKRVVYLNDWEKMPLFEREQQEKFFLENGVQLEKF